MAEAASGKEEVEEMINLLPEPKKLIDKENFTHRFKAVQICADKELPYILDIAGLRFWNYPEITITSETAENSIRLDVVSALEDTETPSLREKELYEKQGYILDISENEIRLQYKEHAGLINGITSIKMLLQESGGSFVLPQCHIIDWPSLAVRAVAPTFSWYAGYGRIGFDSQLWGYDEWVEYLNISLDNKINQFNMIIYGYWPFDLDGYPETVFRNIPIRIWNAENRRWLKVRYTHPNLEDPFLDKFIALAHKLEVKIFSYSGLNSYNGGYSIAHPEKRMVPPKGSGFLNDFDSICLSDEDNVTYIIRAMEEMARLGFDGYTLEESEEGFWFCECDDCKKRYHDTTHTPGEAKHKANMELLNKIYKAVRAINPEIVVGIRAFRQPPLEKDPAYLKELVDSMPDDICLFWAPGLYVPETEFPKWCDAFGDHRIWARDTESNSITSTMGRLYRTFKSNAIRPDEENNQQYIEEDIRQHRGSVARGVHGINGFMFEWYGLFMHEFAHGNYGWGSQMDNEEFYHRACALNFGPWGEDVLYIMRNMLTIHESQINLYTTPFPFQKNKIKPSDRPQIRAAQERHPQLVRMIKVMQQHCQEDPRLRPWLPHFDKLLNAERRNAVIYQMVLASLEYDEETDPVKKDKLLDEILYYNEKDFEIAKEMFFDINPVGFTGVKSCMFPYHEMKRLIYNIRHPEAPDNDIICSGIEALGWLWL